MPLKRYSPGAPYSVNAALHMDTEVVIHGRFFPASQCPQSEHARTQCSHNERTRYGARIHAKIIPVGKQTARGSNRNVSSLQPGAHLLHCSGLAKSLARHPGAIVFSSRATKMYHRPILNTGQGVFKALKSFKYVKWYKKSLNCNFKRSYS